MEKGVLRLCALKKPFRLIQINVKLVQFSKFHNDAILFRKYRHFKTNDIQHTFNCKNGKSFSTQGARQLRKAAKETTEKKQATQAVPVPGIPYNKLSVGVPKETWTNEKRCVFKSLKFFGNVGYLLNMFENYNFIY